MFGQTGPAVADFDGRVVDARTREVVDGGGGEIGPPLDAPYLAGKVGEQRSLVAVSGPHLQHHFRAGELERLHHYRDQ